VSFHTYYLTGLHKAVYPQRLFHEKRRHRMVTYPL
jgi:hypothetical protein